MIRDIRFGEIYELRFQREGTSRQLREHPYTLNHLIFDAEKNSKNSLAASLKEKHLSAVVYYDDVYGLNVKDFEKGQPIQPSKKPDRWVLLTDGPREKTLAHLEKIQESLAGLSKLVDEGKKDLADYNRELIKRYLQENLFPLKIPKLVIRYIAKKLPKKERETLGGHTYHTSTGRSIKAQKRLQWTNKAEVLRTIQAKQIDRLAPTPEPLHHQKNGPYTM